MDKSPKLGSYLVSEEGRVYRLLTICEDTAGRPIFVMERCTKSGEDFYVDRPCPVARTADQVSEFKPYVPSVKLRPGLALAEDGDGVTRAFLVERYASESDLSLWLISDESTFDFQSQWARAGFTNFRMAKTTGGDPLNAVIR